jgi:hypothetical protein
MSGGLERMWGGLVPGPDKLGGSVSIDETRQKASIRTKRLATSYKFLWICTLESKCALTIHYLKLQYMKIQ